MFPDSGFFLKRSDVFMHTHDSKVRYIINVTLPKWLHSSPGWYSERGGLCSHQEGHVFSHLAIMVLDVNFINPYKTAGFPFFNDKKADNSVVKRSAASSTSMWTSTFNNLRPLPKQPPHHIIIVSQCLMISWEKLFIDKIIRPKSKTYTVVQWQFFFLCGKCMRSILMNNRDDCRTICSAAIPFPVWQNPAKYHNKDDFWKPVVNCRTGKGNTKPNLRQTFLFMCFYCFSSVSCDLSERQQGNLYIIWLLYQVRRPVSIWVLPASRWAVPDIHTILVLFASGKWLLSLFSFFYRNCDHWAPFSLPTYH